MKTARQLLIAIIFGTASTIILAGETWIIPVEINFNANGSGSASGNMLAARNSENENESIGCGVRIVDYGGGDIFSWAFCHAGLGPLEEDHIGCTTIDPDMVAAIHSISDFSFVTFSWNPALECTIIGNSTQSYYIPDFKSKKDR